MLIREIMMLVMILLALLCVGAVQPKLVAMEKSNQAELACALATIPFNLAARNYKTAKQHGKAAMMSTIANGLSIANKALFFYNYNKVRGTVLPGRDTVVTGALAVRDLTKIMQDLWPYAKPYLKSSPTVEEDFAQFLDFTHHSTNDVASEEDVFFGNDQQQQSSSSDIFSFDDEKEREDDGFDLATPDLAKPRPTSPIASFDNDPFIFIDDLEVGTLNPEKYQRFNAVKWLKTSAPLLLKNSAIPVLKGVSAAALALLVQYEFFGKYAPARMVAAQAQSLIYLLEEYESHASNKYLKPVFGVAIAVALGGLMFDLAKLYAHMKKLSSSKKVDCDICYSDVSEAPFMYFPCGHGITCDDCIKEQIKGFNNNYTENGRRCCPTKGCKYAMTFRDIKELYKKDNDKNEYFKFFGSVAKFQGGEPCPTKECPHVVFNKEGKSEAYTCPECKHNYCKNCKKEKHDGLSCDRASKVEKNYTKNQMINMLGGYDYAKECPHCYLVTQKNDGCQHMTCSQCKKHWCWRCGVALGSNYSAHFSNGGYYKVVGCKKIEGMAPKDY